MVKIIFSLAAIFILTGIFLLTKKKTTAGIILLTMGLSGIGLIGFLIFIFSTNPSH